MCQTNLCCDNKHGNLLVYLVAALTVNLAYMMFFGQSGRGLIFMYAFQLVCYSLYMTTTVRGKERVAIWTLVLFHILMLIKQTPYMVSTSQGENFIVFFTAVSLTLWFWVMVSFIKTTSDLYRRSGVNPEYLLDGRVYLVVKRPKTLSDYIKNITGSSTHSVSYSIGSDWIRFDDYGYLERVSAEGVEGYSFHNTGIDVTDYQEQLFENLTGTQSSFGKNCVTVWSRFLDNTDFEHKPWEAVPSIYLNRVIKLVQ